MAEQDLEENNKNKECLWNIASCFLCFQPLEIGGPISGKLTGRRTSIRQLCKGLKVDTVALANAHAVEGIARTGKGYVEEMNIHVYLCKTCKEKVEKISKLLLNLEKTKIQLDIGFEEVHKNMKDSLENERVQDYWKKLSKNFAQSMVTNFMGYLRSEIFIKSNTTRLSRGLPQVRIDNESANISQEQQNSANSGRSSIDNDSGGSSYPVVDCEWKIGMVTSVNNILENNEHEGAGTSEDETTMDVIFEDDFLSNLPAPPPSPAPQLRPTTAASLSSPPQLDENSFQTDSISSTFSLPETTFENCGSSDLPIVLDNEESESFINQLLFNSTNIKQNKANPGGKRRKRNSARNKYTDDFDKYFYNEKTKTYFCKNPHCLRQFKRVGNVVKHFRMMHLWEKVAFRDQMMILRRGRGTNRRENISTST